MASNLLVMASNLIAIAQALRYYGESKLDHIGTEDQSLDVSPQSQSMCVGARPETGERVKSTTRTTWTFRCVCVYNPSLLAARSLLGACVQPTFVRTSNVERDS